MAWGRNKYSAKKTYSELCGRTFDSKAEARRGEELALLEKAGGISDLEYQVSFKLCESPNIKIKIDFKYTQDGIVIYEDVKGYGYSSDRVLKSGKVNKSISPEMREFRVKRAWLAEKYNVQVLLTK